MTWECGCLRRRRQRLQQLVGLILMVVYIAIESCNGIEVAA